MFFPFETGYVVLSIQVPPRSPRATRATPILRHQATAQVAFAIV
jgi:hypothetical protein